MSLHLNNTQQLLLCQIPNNAIALLVCKGWEVEVSCVIHILPLTYYVKNLSCLVFLIPFFQIIPFPLFLLKEFDFDYFLQRTR